ncbi:MAG TPA: NAD(P)H-hydrate dehydratase [Chlamydiales bacterium]|mgnify:CR=1 FL=1|nr:NAD(P)H-hydrate dehydratase [Chlamydiales bacterium]
MTKAYEKKPVVASPEMAKAEKLVITEQNEKTFIQSAGYQVYLSLEDFFHEKDFPKEITLVIGKGNNASDALVCGIHLLKKGIKVIAYSPFAFESFKETLKCFVEEFEKKGGKLIHIENMKNFHPTPVIVDGLFGTGFLGLVKGNLKELILVINDNEHTVFSIDIPSGLSRENTQKPLAMRATVTICLGAVKEELFLNHNFDFVGQIDLRFFDKQESFLNKAKFDYEYFIPKDLKNLLPPLLASRHKYNASLALIGGSKGMEGAIALAANSSYRTGAGIVKVYQSQDAEIEKNPLEVVSKRWSSEKVDNLIKELNMAKAVCIGPGLGRDEEVFFLLQNILRKLKGPAVLDADALYFLSKEEMQKFSFPVVLTPHRKEMLRLLNSEEIDDLSLWKQSLTYVNKMNVTLILKGPFSVIFHPLEKPLIMNVQDPALAKAGTGDVLSGIIAALLALGMTSYEAAILGVYIHGQAGKAIASEKTGYSLIASDLFEEIPKVLKKILEKKE